MSERAKNVEAMIASLSAEELLQVLRTVPESTKRLIVDGLSGGDEPIKSISRAWGKAIANRISDIDSGQVKMIPIDEVIAEARERVRRAR
jgi:Putative addiction module component